MSKYVISDIHGCYEEFLEMMNLINFKAKDELFIIGDVFDRGDKPLEIIDYIMTYPNITLIKENHEEFFIDYYNTKELRLWLINGGQSTYNELIIRGSEYEERLYEFISNLPLIEVVDKYILVHSTLNFKNNYNELSLEEFLRQQEKYICLWDRDNIGNEKQYKNYTIICGHTPVQVVINEITTDEKQDEEEVKIQHRKGTIYIDCGCYYGQENKGKLACLRLDDMKEFYVNKKE